ncbi:MAG: amino acid ABC transporter substrate-binding protein [Alicyclobacillus sp.]|nr:amino acid ABC transporter substrate-binding protein [Alicyclobacillus sp.]
MKSWVRMMGAGVMSAVTALALSGGGAAAAAAKDDGTITIGTTLSLTGIYAEPAAQYKLVDDYWVKQINSHGGLLGKKVKMIIYDDQSNPANAASLYQQLINQDHVNFILAPYTTYVGSPVVPIALSHHMVLFNPGFVGMGLFKKANGWMISTYPYQDVQYSQRFFQWLHSLPKSKRPTKIAVLTNQNPFTLAALQGYNGKDGVLNYAKQYGFKIVLNQQYPESTTNFDSLIEKAKLAGADCLIALTLPNDGMEIARTVAKLNYHPKVEFFGGSQVTTLPNWGSLGAAAEGTMSTTPAMPNENFTGLAELVKLFKQHGIKVLPGYAAIDLAALQVLQQAVTATQSLDQTTIKNYVLSHTFDTAVGKIHYNPDGTLPNTSLVIQYQHGTNIVVWPKKYATGQPELPKP